MKVKESRYGKISISIWFRIKSQSRRHWLRHNIGFCRCGNFITSRLNFPTRKSSAHIIEWEEIKNLISLQARFITKFFSRSNVCVHSLNLNYYGKMSQYFSFCAAMWFYSEMLFSFTSIWTFSTRIKKDCKFIWSILCCLKSSTTVPIVVHESHEGQGQASQFVNVDTTKDEV